MTRGHDPRLTQAFATLAAAPSASDPATALLMSTLWLGLVLLSQLVARWMPDPSSAGFVLRVVACTTVAAALLTIMPLEPHLAALWPGSIVLLALTTAMVPVSPLRSLGLQCLCVTAALLVVGVARLWLPPMAPATGAAIGLAALAGLLALWPADVQNAADTAKPHER